MGAATRGSVERRGGDNGSNAVRDDTVQSTSVGRSAGVAAGSAGATSALPAL